ncbi:MAG: PH domain-containing protein [Planctomycetota bacterium]|nr:PH domain-containing protein [Planctomycetota bacterium]
MPPQPPPNVILEADFDVEALIKYHWTSLGFIALFIVTIPFVIIGAIIYWLLLPRIVANWSAQLTDRALIVRKGVFTKIEKTIPLEKITDLSSTQGPVMRLFDLKQLGVETAGQSGAAGASLVTLLGIRGTDDFRTRVLAQRDAITSGAPVAPVAEGSSSAAAASTGGNELADIASTLRRIEATLDRIADDRPAD